MCRAQDPQGKTWIAVWVETIRYGTTGLGSLAAAFFVLFAAPAGAWIVAADLGSSSHGFGSLGLCRAGLKLQLLLLTALTAFDFAGFVFGAGRLNEEEIANGLTIDAAHHVFEKGESLLL